MLSTVLDCLIAKGRQIGVYDLAPRDFQGHLTYRQQACAIEL